MRERLTARVILIDALDRILLMKARSPAAPEGAGVWFTVGGGAEPGETVLEAAAREIREETGFDRFELGPVVWRREGMLNWGGAERLFKESYVVARCAGGAISRAGWDAAERALIDDIRWWSRDEIAASAEPIYPAGLAELLIDVLAGAYPAEPMTLPWR